MRTVNTSYGVVKYDTKEPFEITAGEYNFLVMTLEIIGKGYYLTTKSDKDENGNVTIAHIIEVF